MHLAQRAACLPEQPWDVAVPMHRGVTSRIPILQFPIRAASTGLGGGAEDGSGEEPDSNELGVAEELAVAAPQRMGWFRFYFDEQRWEWSEDLQRLHGYQPGTVAPTTELVLSHKHPGDRDEVAANIDDITHTRGAFRSRHRIVDTGGIVRWVVVIGDQFFDETGAVTGTHGFYVDVTPARHLHEGIISAHVSEIADKRASIEQAKGMLMFIYDIDEQVAFDLLKWLSQKSNVKLRALAKQISTDLRAVAQNNIVGKATFDHTLLTAYQRLRAGRRSSE